MKNKMTAYLMTCLANHVEMVDVLDRTADEKRELMLTIHDDINKWAVKYSLDAVTVESMHSILDADINKLN